MTGKKSRHRYKVETDLPREIREQLNRLLLEGMTYEEGAIWCRDHGYDISSSSIGRYGKWFIELYQEILQFNDQAQILTADVDDGMPMEEAVGKMLLKKVWSALIDGSADITENSRLIGEVAKLQRSHVIMNQFKIDLENRARQAAAEVGELVKKGGLSDDAANIIKAKILGIVKK